MARYYTKGNTPATTNTVVCEKNWPKNYPTKLDYGKERARDPPSVLTFVKPSQVSTLPPRKISIVKELAEIRNLLPDRERRNKRCSWFFIWSSISQF